MNKRRRIVPDSDGESSPSIGSDRAKDAEKETWVDDQGRTWIADPQAIADYNAFYDEYIDILEQLPNEIPRNHALMRTADKVQVADLEAIKTAMLSLYSGIPMSPTKADLPYTSDGITFTPTQQQDLHTIAHLSQKRIRAAKEQLAVADTTKAIVERHIRRLDADLLMLQQPIIPVEPRVKRPKEPKPPKPKEKEKEKAVDMPLESALPTDPITANTTLDDTIYCYCRRPQMPGDVMIACENEDCPTQWFHVLCTEADASRLNDRKYKWYCEVCRKQRKRQAQIEAEATTPA